MHVDSGTTQTQKKEGRKMSNHGHNIQTKKEKRKTRLFPDLGILSPWKCFSIKKCDLKKKKLSYLFEKKNKGRN